MSRFFIISAALLFTTSADAADLVVSEPAPQAASAVYDWSGFYAGLQAGYGSGEHDRLTTAGFANSYDSDGWFGGVFLGYNRQYPNNVVVGVETDWNLSTIDGNDGGVGGSLDTTDMDVFGSVRGRLGYAFDRILAFGTGGLAVGVFEHTNTLGVGSATNDTEFGWTAGAGIEFAVTNTIAVRGEYRYYDFGDYTVTAPVNGVDEVIVSTPSQSRIISMC